jgi:hypothetical protein
MRVRAGVSAPFGSPHLIDGENSAEYDELLTRVSATVNPADILEGHLGSGRRGPHVGNVAISPAEARAYGNDRSQGTQRDPGATLTRFSNPRV